MFHSEFFRNWEAKYGPECARALFLDSSEAVLNLVMDWTLGEIREFMAVHARFTARDLKFAHTSGVDIQIALAAMVEAGELRGPNPYAHEPTGPLDELVYEIPRWRIEVHTASLFGAGPIHHMAARDFGEAEHLSSAVLNGEYWGDVMWVITQVNCDHHGWQTSSYGSCDLCMSAHEEWFAEMHDDLLDPSAESESEWDRLFEDWERERAENAPDADGPSLPLRRQLRPHIGYRTS